MTSEIVGIVIVAVIAAVVAVTIMVNRLYKRIWDLEDDVVRVRNTVSELVNDAAYTRFLVRGNVPESEQYRSLYYVVSSSADADAEGGQE